MKVITVVSSTDNDGFRQLKRSLDYHGFELDVLIHPFQFGGQMQHVYKWCKNNWGLFLYTDGWDTFALGPVSEVLEKFEKLDCDLLLSAEKNCYPIRETADLYPKCDSEWRYVNGGGFMGRCETFVELFEDGTHQHVHEKNDQQWLAEEYCGRHKDGRVKLDTNCEIFQTIAFENPRDFGRELSPIEKHDGNWNDRLRLVNNHTRSRPIFIHGNAHTTMDKIYKLL